VTGVAFLPQEHPLFREVGLESSGDVFIVLGKVVTEEAVGLVGLGVEMEEAHLMYVLRGRGGTSSGLT
jgi:hypothetical protein